MHLPRRCSSAPKPSSSWKQNMLSEPGAGTTLKENFAKTASDSTRLSWRWTAHRRGGAQRRTLRGTGGAVGVFGSGIGAGSRSPGGTRSGAGIRIGRCWSRRPADLAAAQRRMHLYQQEAAAAAADLSVWSKSMKGGALRSWKQSRRPRNLRNQLTQAEERLAALDRESQRLQAEMLDCQFAGRNFRRAAWTAGIGI